MFTLTLIEWSASLAKGMKKDYETDLHHLFMPLPNRAPFDSQQHQALNKEPFE